MASDDEPQISILDARLADIDRRLSRIQTGLAEEVTTGAPEGGVPAGGLAPRIAVPEPGAPPAVVPPPALREPSDDAGDDAQLVVAELRGLITDHARLLDRLGEILASGERVLTAATRVAAGPPAPAAPARPPAPAAPAAPARPEVHEPAAVTVTAGPFASIEAVRGFERALQGLPGVAGVEVRGYEGGDRAVVDVHLAAETA